MNKILTAVALSIAFPAVAQAQAAPAPMAQSDRSDKMGKSGCKDMDHSKMDHAKMDHLKMGHGMKAGADTHAGHDMSKAAAPVSHQH
jgi:hypothetical protein